jgi:acyl dehydratase
MEELPPYRVQAKNTSASSENKIHDDAVARRLGFKGGLVPGVTVYAYMTYPVVAALGPELLARGTFSVRLRKPVYEGEVVTVTARVSARGETSTTLDVAALNPDGEPCALGTAALDRGSRAATPDLAAYPAASLPTERPPATRERLAALAALGSPQLTLDEAAGATYLDETDEPLPLYRGPGAPAHPALFLHQANRALDRNVLMGPWIHASSEIRHLNLWRVGEPLATRGRVRALWEKSGHEYVELDLLMVAGETRPVAHVQHRCIYRLGPR